MPSEFIDYFNTKFSSLVEMMRGTIQYYITATPNKSGYDQVQGHKVGSNDPQYQIGVRRMASYGMRSLPPYGSESIELSVNAALGNKVQVASENIKYGPTDLEEGESSFFSMFKQLLRFKKNGDATLDSGENSSGTKADIILNGGSKKIARVDDHAKVTLRTTYVVVPGTPPGFTLTHYVVNPDGSQTILFSFTVIAGSVSIPAAPVIPYDVEVDSTIFEGADHALA